MAYRYIRKPNNALHQIMQRQHLSRQSIASFLNVSVNTVHKWLLPPRSKTYRKIPETKLELLLLKLAIYNQDN